MRFWCGRCYVYLVMDIARPEIKRKRKRRIVWIGTGVIAAAIVATSIFVSRMDFRHHREYITVAHDGRALQVLVDVPAKPRQGSPVVVLVHEVYGLSDWAKGMADELADRGFTVIAPDLLSGHGPSGGGYGDFANENDVTQAVSSLDSDTVMADLDAVTDYGKSLPNFAGKIAVVGFSWGGWRSFAFAARRRDLSAVFVFYGTGPSDVGGITAPVYAFYAGNDVDVDATVPVTTVAMKAAGKVYEPVTYEGAEHGFMRLGEEPGDSNPANKAARVRAFERLIGLLGQMKVADTR